MKSIRIISLFITSLILSINALARLKQQKGNAQHPELSQEEIKAVLLKHEIIPDVIDEAPPNVLKVGYTKAGVIVDFGNNITREQSREAPTSVSWPTKHNDHHTLIMIDPDFPSFEKRKKERQWHHWLVVNIPGCNMLKGTELSEYIPVEAKNNTGRHRYIFLAYKQPQDEMEFEELHTIAIPVDSLRSPFSCREFSKKYNMTGPVAINFFKSQFGRLWPKHEIDPKIKRKHESMTGKVYQNKKKKQPII